MLKFSDLAARVAEKLFLKQQEVEDFLTLIVDVIEKGLYEDKQVKIKGLGTFKMTAVSARESVDVNTGERILIDSREKISFVPDVSMRDWVNKPFAQFETVLVSNDVDFGEVDEKYRDEEDEETESETVSFLEPVSDIAQEAIDNTTEDTSDAAAVETTDVTAEIAEAVSETTDIAEEILEKDSQEDAIDSPQPQTIDFAQEEEELPEPQTIDFVQEESPIVSDVAQEEETPTIDFLPEETPVINDAVVPEEAPEINDIVQEEEILPVADFVQEETPEIADDVQEEESVATVVVPEQEMTEPEQETAEPEQETAALVQETAEPVQKEEPLIVKVVQEEPETTENSEEETENKSNDDDLFDKYGYYVGPYGGQSTLRRLLKSKNTFKVLVFILFIAMTAMMGFLYSEIKERDNRIDQFIEELKKVTTDGENNAIEEEADEESLNEEEEDAEETADSNDKNEDEKTAQFDAEKQTQRTDNDSHNTARTQDDESGSASIEAYNRDPLVQAGDYQIIGIAQTMIVRDGQSFTGISKAFLGPNKEDYLSVVNGGIRSVKPGQKLKIPFLKMKKNRASKT